MGLANWLTTLRILLIPVFVSLLVYRKPGPALVVFAAAALTDLLDGWIARRQRSQSRLGAFLDPMADKLLLTASFVTLTYLKVLPFWIAAVVISRDVILVVGTLLVYMLGARDQRPTAPGRDRLRLPRGRGDARAHGRARGRRADAPARAPRRRSRRRARAAPGGRDRDLREQVRVLLHPPAPEGDAAEPLRQGRRLPAVVSPRQLHHAHRSRRGGVRAHHRAAALAALRLRARDRPDAASRAARAPARLRRDPPAARAPREGGDPHARPDRALSGLERRPVPRAHRLRPRPPPAAGCDDRDRPRRAHASPRAAARAPEPHPGRGARADRGRGGLAARLARRARQPFRLPRRRDLPARRPGAAARPRLRGVSGGRGRNRAGPPVRGRLRPGDRAAVAARGAGTRHARHGEDVRPAPRRAAQRGRARRRRRPDRARAERLLRQRNRRRGPPHRPGHPAASRDAARPRARGARSRRRSP